MRWPVARLQIEEDNMIYRKIENDSIVFTDGSSTFLTIQEEETEDAIQLEIVGELRSDIAHDLLDELIALATVGANIRINFEKVSYITPTIQHVFLRVQQKMDSLGKGTLTLRKLPQTIYQEFEATGTSELLMIE